MAAYISTIAFVIAHATNAFVADALYVPSYSPSVTLEPADSGQTELPDENAADIILHSGLFALPKIPTNQLEATPAPPPAPINAVKKVVLLGTVFNREAGVMAVLEDISTKHQDLYRLGGLIANVGTLVAIEKHRVLFREGESEEWLDLTLGQQNPSLNTPRPIPAAAPAASSPQRKLLDRRELTDAMADMTRLLSQAQAVPNLKEGKLDGFRLLNVTMTGFFDKIGLQTNDIVQRVNGVELRDPSMFFSLFQQLKDERTVRVDLVRGTQRLTLAYEIR